MDNRQSGRPLRSITTPQPEPEPGVAPAPAPATQFTMSGLTSSILLPLYIYPLPKAWDRLFIVIEKYPTLEFTIIINPNSGPGDEALPDEDYRREITRLNRYPNVTLVGYVRVDWCQRDLEKACDEIETYAGWSRHGSGELALQGIFFDETPNLYTAERKLFMDAADCKVKSAAGIMGSRLFANPGPDLTTIFETTYQYYTDQEVQQRLANLLRYDRDRCSYMVLAGGGGGEGFSHPCGIGGDEPIDQDRIIMESGAGR
ncbi:cell surface spherulin 4-like protein [Diplocarpon rosae]|nr:cell surface spherulin 4-like protein [Diplocarpon rosae]